MQTTHNDALARITEVIMFENWLRFYFIAEKNDALFIEVPEQALNTIQNDYPTLAGLANELNNKEITHQGSVNAVCLFVAQEIDGISIPQQVIQHVLDSQELSFELNLFSVWIQNHEEQLDSTFLPFAHWQKLYTEWKNSTAVQEYITSMRHSLPRVATDINTTTQ